MSSEITSTTAHAPRHARAAAVSVAPVVGEARPRGRHAATRGIQVAEGQSAPRHRAAHARHAAPAKVRLDDSIVVQAVDDAALANDTVPVAPNTVAFEVEEQEAADATAVSTAEEAAHEEAAISTSASAKRESTVPASRYRAAVTALVAAVALFAIVFVASPFNPMNAIPSAPTNDRETPAAATATYGGSAYADDQFTVSEEDAALLGQVLADGVPLSNDLMAYVASQSAPYTSQIGTMLQNEVGLPSGCEVVSLSLLLQSLGFDVMPSQIVDEHLVMDGSFSTGYAGSPYGAGGGFPPGITKAANSYLGANGSELHAYNLTGSTFEGLKGLMAHGYPVLVWTTMYGEQPMSTGTYENGVQWYDNEHCVVVYGVTDEGVLTSDPLEGYVVRDEAEFVRIYDLCGNMALAVL